MAEIEKIILKKEIMMKSLTIFLTCFTIIIVLLNGKINAQSSNLLFERVQNTIELETDYTYGALNASNDYLAWIEFLKAEIFIRDLSTGDTKIIQLTEGRGPGEYIALTDLEIRDDKIYVSDPRNNKLIEVEIASEEKRDLSFRENRIFRFVSHQSGFFLLEHVRPDVLISSYQLDEKRAFPMNDDELDLQEEFGNPFYKEGYIIAQKDKILLVTKYRPYIYTYSEKKGGLSKKIVFDDSEVEDITTTKNEEGVKAMYPPAEVDILIEDAVVMDAKPNSVFLLARGKGNNREYRLNELHEYDLVEEKFVTKYDLGVKAENITANADYLFVYSEDESKVFQYKIREN